MTYSSTDKANMKKLITVHVITMKRKVFRKQTANRRRQSLQITGKHNVFRKINQRVFCVVYLNLCLLCVRRCNSFIRVFALQNLALQVSRYLNAFITHHGYIRPFGNGLLHISSKIVQNKQNLSTTEIKSKSSYAITQKIITQPVTKHLPFPARQIVLQ